MKKTIYLLALFSGLFLASPPASAVNDPLDYRRTLFVPVAGTMLYFEAPDGMCFIDPAKNDSTDAAYAGTKDTVNASRTDVLLAVFAPCLSISAAMNGEKSPTIVGFITWLNPAVGERTNASPDDYAAQQAQSFKGIVKKSLTYFGSMRRASKYPLGLLPPSEAYQIDKMPRVHNRTVSIGYTASFEYEYEKYNLTGVSATTALRGIPIATVLRQTDGLPGDMKALYKLADDFLEQQSALNP